MKSEIQSHDAFVEIRFSGEADTHAFMYHLESLRQSDKWQPNAQVLVEMTRLNASPVTISDMLRLKGSSLELQSRAKNSRIAILVSRNLEYGMVRMWMTLVGDDMEISMAVFRNREKAVSWLVNTESDIQVEQERKGTNLGAGCNTIS